jgi:hypothetical protein
MIKILELVPKKGYIKKPNFLCQCISKKKRTENENQKYMDSLIVLLELVSFR